jgi:hypothetical protein
LVFIGFHWFSFDGLFSSRGRNDVRLAWLGHLWKADHDQRGSDAEGAGDVERGKVSGEFGACRASAKCRGCRTKLSDAKRNETGGEPAENAIAAGFNPCSRSITALVSPFHF